MALQTPRLRFWPFPKAPLRLRSLFHEGDATDWVASVPESLADVAEFHFLRLRQLHPVTSVRLPNKSIIYWGAPRESITLIANQYAPLDPGAPFGRERRIGTRVPLGCTLRYETGSPAYQETGAGRVIDMSSSGVSFTTESLLRSNTRVALHVAWPVRLDGDVPVELYAEGNVVRAEPHKAALQYDRIAFKIGP